MPTSLFLLRKAFNHSALVFRAILLYLKLTVPEQDFKEDGNYIIVLAEKDCDTENCDDKEYKLAIEHTVANIVG